MSVSIKMVLNILFDSTSGEERQTEIIVENNTLKKVFEIANKHDWDGHFTSQEEEALNHFWDTKCLSLGLAGEAGVGFQILGVDPETLVLHVPESERGEILECFETYEKAHAKRKRLKVVGRDCAIVPVSEFNVTWPGCLIGLDVED